VAVRAQVTQLATAMVEMEVAAVALVVALAGQ
jgi:hypothetical protein